MLIICYKSIFCYLCYKTNLKKGNAMKTKGWILTVLSSILLIVLLSTLAYVLIAGQAASVHAERWWWAVANLSVLTLLFGYGLMRGLRILRMYRIPTSELAKSPGIVVCDYSISLKRYAYFKLWDFRHFSFSLLLILYICIAFLTGNYVIPNETSFGTSLFILFLCLVYGLIVLPIRLNKIYKQSVVGQTWVEISPEGLTYDRVNQKQTILWKEFNGIAIYKDYCFLYNTNGFEFLVVTSDKHVIESILYYLNKEK